MTSCIPLVGKGALILLVGLAACQPSAQIEPLPVARTITPTAFDIDAVDDPLATGHLLMRAGQYELALRAYTRVYATGQADPSGQVEAALGTVNAQLGRLRAAERFLDIAVEKAPTSVEAWNNLGVVTLSLRNLTKARNALRTAFALSDGTNDAARENLARIDELQGTDSAAPQGLPPRLALVRHGAGRYLLDTPSGGGETE